MCQVIDQAVGGRMTHNRHGTSVTYGVERVRYGVRTIP
jgi:hypothetical protein